tara:strand:- start:887 stop:1075 length:189 start_codon:yes stop_codon:yes gene_type:complete
MTHKIQEGMTVNYWAGLKKNEPTGTAKVTAVGKLGNIEMAWLDNGKCYATSHIVEAANDAAK